jgi:hypothetical protein
MSLQITSNSVVFPDATTLSSGVISASQLSTGHPSWSTAGMLSSTGLSFSDKSTILTAPNNFGFKNRLINGAFSVAQKGLSGIAGTVASPLTGTYPSVDRWYAYSTGGTVTTSQSASKGLNFLSVAGISSVSAVGIGQRIEAVNCADLAGSNAALSLVTSNSFLSSMSWIVSYAGSTDVWTTKTLIASGALTINSTQQQFTTTFAIPTAATTGIEVLFTTGAQTSGAWTLSNIQLEKGSTATSFDYRPYGTELILCQRYYEVLYKSYYGVINTGPGYGGSAYYKVTKRVIPSIAMVNVQNSNFSAWVIPTVYTDSFSFYGTGTASTASYTNMFMVSAEL